MHSHTRWTAQWIAPATSAPNSWLCFRRQITLPAAPAHARARIAVDSKYWLWINGALALFEGGLKRGPTPSDTYYDELDLAPYLTAGPNTFAVLVWYWGQEGFSHKDSGAAGLLFEADIDGLSLCSDRQWTMRIHPAYIPAVGPAPNFRLPEPNVAFDARLDLGAWMAPAYDDAAWDAPVERGAPPTPPWHALWPRPIPPWRDSGLRAYANAAELPAVGDGRVIVARLPYNAQITPYLQIDAPAGMRIDMRMDNFDMPGIEPHHAEYITRAGVQAYESLGWLNGHAVHYRIPAGVQLLALGYRETGYDTDVAGSFACDDPFYAALWRKALRTLYVTMRDTYMDCPDRERAQWWGDAVIELGAAFYAFEPRASRLARKGMRELAHWQRADHTLYAPVPAGNWQEELPLQMLASIGEYGFWTYYRYTGDAETIAAVYPHVRDYLSRWQLGPDGLVVHRPGGWDWADWGTQLDVAILDNAWYVLALAAACHMAQLTGHVADIPAYRAHLASIKAHFHATCWTGDAYRSPAYAGETDDRANALAVLAGLVPAAQWPAVRQVLQREMHASPYMEKYVLEALFVMRDPAAALARMRARYAESVADPCTTLPELFPGGAQTGSYNHAWSGGPLTLLPQYVAGIAPEEPAYARYHVFPQLGPLHAVTTTVPTLHGPIHLHLTRDARTFTLQLTSPPHTQGLIGIPHDYPTVTAPPSLRAAGHTPHYQTFTVPPGTWRFIATR